MARITKGMTQQEVEAMVEATEGWEFMEYEPDVDDYPWIWQGDHALAVEFDDDGRVCYMEFVPRWAL